MADASDAPEPEYAFDGYQIEFSVKSALTPPTPVAPKAPANGPGAS